jgi:hypothetical protein
MFTSRCPGLHRSSSPSPSHLTLVKMVWRCDRCTYEANKDDRTLCEMCGGKKPAGGSVGVRPPAGGVPGGGNGGGGGAAAERWKCPSCTFENNASARLCDVCSAAKPAVTGRPLPNTIRPPMPAEQEAMIAALTKSAGCSSVYARSALQAKVCRLLACSSIGLLLPL